MGTLDHVLTTLFLVLKNFLAEDMLRLTNDCTFTPSTPASPTSPPFFYDLILRCQKRNFFVHKFILSERIPAFFELVGKSIKSNGNDKDSDHEIQTSSDDEEGNSKGTATVGHGNSDGIEALDFPIKVTTTILLILLKYVKKC